MTLDMLKDIDSTARKINSLVAEPDRIAQDIIDERVHILYPRISARQKKSDKRTVSERIADLDVVDFINHFSPCKALKMPVFKIAASSILNERGGIKLEDLKNQFNSYKLSLPHEPVKQAMLSWWEGYVLPRIE